MSTKILLADDGEALVQLSTGLLRPDNLEPAPEQITTAHTGMFFDDPFATPKRKPKGETSDYRWLFYPRLETAKRMAQYLTEYAKDAFVVEAITEVTPAPPSTAPSQLFILVLVNTIRVKFPAGELANDLIRSTYWDAEHRHIAQVPERVFAEAVRMIVTEASKRNEDDIPGDIVYRFERPVRVHP